jgi:hypothetical protein
MRTVFVVSGGEPAQAKARRLGSRAWRLGRDDRTANVGPGLIAECCLSSSDQGLPLISPFI